MPATALRQGAGRRRRPVLTAVTALVLIAHPAFAAALDLPAPWALAARTETPASSYRLPIGRWVPQGLPTREIEGAVTRSAFQRPLEGGSTLDLLTPLRAALEAHGFRPLFQCETESCGGFDFRYAADVLPEPEMHVDLGDFRFLSALRDTPDGPEAISLLVSRSAATGFVQLVRVGARVQAAPVPDLSASSKSPEPPPGTIGDRLSDGGPVVLEDLAFASGSSRLEDRSYPALADLADWLKVDAARRVAIVGHTDASGSLEANVTVSRARAASVRERLISRHGVPEAQVTAEGVGYLAPRDTNRTEDGRARNRRVEVVPTAP